MREEQQLKKFLLNGDYSSVETVIRQYEDNLYSLCRKLTSGSPDADDLYQQTWLKAFQSAQGYKAKSFKNWLYTICLNTYRDQCRRAKNRGRVTSEWMDTEAKEFALSLATDGVSTESIVIENYTKAQLLEKVSQLPEKHRVPIVLHYFEDMDYSECARVMKIPVGTVKSRLNSAKKKLLDEMEKSSIV